jgi:hypothetical protein
MRVPARYAEIRAPVLIAPDARLGWIKQPFETIP